MKGHDSCIRKFSLSSRPLHSPPAHLLPSKRALKLPRKCRIREKDRNLAGEMIRANESSPSFSSYTSSSAKIMWSC